jgi:beta-mannosidase
MKQVLRNTIASLATGFFLAFLPSCAQEANEINIVISDGWEFSEVGTDNWLSAKVPGTVHADLMKAGIIEDPHYRLNENDAQWIETKDWEYRTTFFLEKKMLAWERLELDFEGLDTYAEVFLNDSLILKSDNMFVGFSLDVKSILKVGNNDLRIVFLSPVNEGMKKLKQIDYIIPAVNEQAPEDERTNVFTRKAPFHYGWDWGPRLVTSGIWRPITLKARGIVAIEDVFVQTQQISAEEALLSSIIEIYATEAGTYELSLAYPESSSSIKNIVTLKEGLNVINFDFSIENPRLWWSNGLGEQYLYALTFRLEKNNSVLSAKELNFGVRTLKLVQTPDEVGRSFYFELNGVPVFMKGANVIPSETLTPSVTREQYNRLIKNTVDANMNMLRVWGGAIYEEDYFYELCDKNGILIWQDFMFACALQPGDEAHLENIRQEAIYNVRRLRNYASLALWCGNNENLHGIHHWWDGMFEPEVEAFMWRTYERIFHEILPQVVKEHHSGIDYWSTSPSAYENQLADRKSGDEHDWTIWFGEKPFSAYGEDVPRFVSEYGLQAFPGMHTINDFSVADDRDIKSTVMRHRQRGKMEYVAPGFDGNDMIKRYMSRYYNVPEKFEHFVYVSQLLHAKAYKTALESHRRNMPHCMGSLYWQINDSWPAISWATVDYYGRWKAAHYAVRKANEEIIVAPALSNNVFDVYAVSDRLETLSNVELSVVAMDFNGKELFVSTNTIDVPSNTSTKVYSENFRKLAANLDYSSMLVYVALKDGEEVLANNIFYAVNPKEQKLPAANIKTSVVKNETGYSIEVSSDVLVRNLFIDTPYGDVFASDNYFDLLPGTSKSIDLITNRTLDVDNEISFFSLNDLN